MAKVRLEAGGFSLLPSSDAAGDAASVFGVDELQRYAFSKEYQSINEKFLAPIRKDYAVMDYAEHGHGMGSGTTSKL